MIRAVSSLRPVSRDSRGDSLSVAAEAQRRLQQSSYPSHRRLECRFHGGVLTIQGRVPSFYLRQVAWALVTGVRGIDEFVDQMEVDQKFGH